jgi:mannose/fructose/N-acetylgalactosamine-specific phosphotransferase system component IIC
MSLGPLALVLALTAWGTFVGFDLVTFPQGLFSRPLVTGLVAGWLTGDIAAGLRVGATLELFALEVLPVGAARYPDYGPGTVAAVWFATGRPWLNVLGFAVLLALGLALAGGWAMARTRRINGRSIERAAAGLAAGDPESIARVQRRGILADLERSLFLTLAGLALAWVARALLPLGNHAGLVSAVAVGSGLAAAASGAIRSAGRGRRLGWLVAGVLAGSLLAVGR